MKLRLIYLIGFLFIARAGLSQDQVISGKVVDPGGNPLSGVNILVKGTTNGTITDETGRFKITAPSNSILVLTFIGYQSTEVLVGSQSELEVVLGASTDSPDHPYYCCTDKAHKAAPHCGRDPEKLKEKFKCNDFKKI